LPTTKLLKVGFMTEGEIGRQVYLVGKNKINGKVNLKK
jgi:hypothetical protein